MHKVMAFVPIIFILFGCLKSGSAIEPNDLTRNFFHNKGISEQVRLFPNYSLDEQYELLIFGNQVVHPPATYLAYEFSKQGPIIVPFLKTKLQTVKDELTIRDIVSVFNNLAVFGRYDFSKDQDLMNLLEQRANGMKGIWKDTVSGMVGEIIYYSKKP